MAQNEYVKRSAPRAVITDRGNGPRRLARWQAESTANLIAEAIRLEVMGEADEFTVQVRKRTVIALQRQQADIATVRNCTWACANRKQRAALIAFGVVRGL